MIQAVASKVDELKQDSHFLFQALPNADPELGLPDEWVYRYHAWYAACLALVETNMPERVEELERLHSGGWHGNLHDWGVLDYLRDATRLWERTQDVASLLVHMQGVVGSIPSYLDARLHDLELKVAQAYVAGELAEAQALLKAGHLRAAGAVAGVVLERHLKLLCDRHQPPIKYTRKDGISKLNDRLRDASVYDMAQWRKVQWMGDIRNECDHPGTDEPRRQDVGDLIAEVKKFVAVVVI